MTKQDANSPPWPRDGWGQGGLSQGLPWSCALSHLPNPEDSVPNQTRFYRLQFTSITLFSIISNFALSSGVFSLLHRSGFCSLKPSRTHTPSDLPVSEGLPFSLFCLSLLCLQFLPIYPLLSLLGPGSVPALYCNCSGQGLQWGPSYQACRPPLSLALSSAPPYPAWLFEIDEDPASQWDCPDRSFCWALLSQWETEGSVFTTYDICFF